MDSTSGLVNRTLMVMVSGHGSTLDNIAKSIKEGTLDAKITCVICNRVNVGAADVATRWKLPYYIFDPKVFPAKAEWNNVFNTMLDIYQPGLVICAGFNQLLPVPVRYKGRMLNVHPSLLPKFGGKGMYGDRVHWQVLNSGEKKSGCTVHVMTEEYDKGQVEGIAEVEISEHETVDSLRTKVQAAERRLYPRVINNYLNKLSDPSRKMIT